MLNDNLMAISNLLSTLLFLDYIVALRVMLQLFMMTAMTRYHGSIIGFTHSFFGMIIFWVAPLNNWKHLIVIYIDLCDSLFHLCPFLFTSITRFFHFFTRLFHMRTTNRSLRGWLNSFLEIFFWSVINPLWCYYLLRRPLLSTFSPTFLETLVSIADFLMTMIF